MHKAPVKCSLYPRHQPLQAAKPAVKREEGNKLVSDFERLLDSSTLADVKIKCEGKVVECHKAILSARYFTENMPI